MAGYSKSYNKLPGDIIETTEFDGEFDSLETAFDESLGHAHDGTLNNGAYIPIVSSPDNRTEVRVDPVTDTIIFAVDNGASKENQCTILDGAITPETTNDFDIGSVSLKFKDMHLAGNANVDGTANIGTLSLTTGASVTSILDEDTMVTDSDVALATQQSIKAYVGTEISTHVHDGVTNAYNDIIASADGYNAVEVDDPGNSIIFSTDVASVKTNQLIVNSSSIHPAVNDGLTAGTVSNKFATVYGTAGNFTSLVLNGNTVTNVYDEDTLASNSDTALATQQSIKAYVDTNTASSTHTHNGVDSPTLDEIQSPDGYNRVWVNDTDNRIVFQVDVASVRTSKASISATALFPATDIDIDLGRTDRRFTNAYIQTVNADTLTTITLNGDITISPNGTGDVVLGNFTLDGDQTVGAGQDNYVLTYDNGSGLISLETLPDYNIISLNGQTGTTYTLALSDGASLVTMTNAAANTLTVPLNSSVAFPIGTQIVIEQGGAGQTTISPAGGVTINSAGSLTNLTGQYSTATLIKKATDTWLLAGDLA